MTNSEPLGVRTYALKSGKTFNVYLYKRRGGRTISLRCPYGHLEAFIFPNTDLRLVDKMVNNYVNNNPGAFLNRDYMVPGKYVYVLGKRLLFTNNPKNKGNPDFFYLPDSFNFENLYKKTFLEYAYKRTQEWAEEMEIDFDGYCIKSGKFISMFGNCCPSKKTIKYDYRLFAYKPEISDSIIVHELTHIYYLDHSRQFYNLLYEYCPDYDDYHHCVNIGDFEGVSLHENH